MNILECHSRGDKRFSAFYARLASGHTIEQLYQSAKLDTDGKRIANARGVSPAYLYINKGILPCDNQLRHLYYAMLWHAYFLENPDLLEFAAQHEGFRDIFSHKGAIYPMITHPDHRIDYAKGGCNQAQAIAWLTGRQGYFCSDEPRLIEALQKYWQRYHGEDYPIGYQ